MELAQTGHHLWCGTYLAYLSNANLGAKIFLLSPWDSSVRKAFRRWLSDVARHPGHLFSPVRVQSVGIIQAPDLIGDGRADMCELVPRYDGVGWQAD